MVFDGKQKTLNQVGLMLARKSSAVTYDNYLNYSDLLTYVVYVSYSDL